MIKKIFLSLKFLGLITTLFSAQILSIPISLQLFTKPSGTSGITKKIAIVGLDHSGDLECPQKENKLKDLMFKIMNSVIQKNLQTSLDNLGFVDILLEAPNVQLQEKLHSQYTMFAKLTCQTVPACPLEYQLIKQKPDFRHPFRVYQADIRKNFPQLANFSEANPTTKMETVHNFSEYNAQLTVLLNDLLNLIPGLTPNIRTSIGEVKLKIDSILNYAVFFNVLKEKTHIAKYKEAFENLVQLDLANVGFMIKILKSQTSGNRTMLFCGNDHIFGLIETILPLLGYERQRACGILEKTTTEQYVINTDNFEKFVCDFIGCCACGKISRNRCPRCNLERFCEDCKGSEKDHRDHCK